MSTQEGLPPNYPFQPDWEVTPRQVKAMLDAGDDFVLIDCRTPGEYQVTRVEGSVLVPLQEVAARLPELEKYRDQKIVVNCHHGVRSLRMTAALRQQGFEDVKSMAGGIDLWAMDIEPGMKRY
ncbi:MAG: rhodanese [Planctomycetes bacterium]|nr:rhodanese [Planctomycetota bacterium]